MCKAFSSTCRPCTFLSLFPTSSHKKVLHSTTKLYAIHKFLIIFPAWIIEDRVVRDHWTLNVLQYRPRSTSIIKNYKAKTIEGLHLRVYEYLPTGWWKTKNKEPKDGTHQPKRKCSVKSQHIRESYLYHTTCLRTGNTTSLLLLSTRDQICFEHVFASSRVSYCPLVTRFFCSSLTFRGKAQREHNSITEEPTIYGLGLETWTRDKLSKSDGTIK